MLDLSTLVIFCYCDACGGTTAHDFLGDSGKYEIYGCQVCGFRVEYEVR